MSPKSRQNIENEDDDEYKDESQKSDFGLIESGILNEILYSQDLVKFLIDAQLPPDPAQVRQEMATMLKTLLDVYRTRDFDRFSENKHLLI